MHQANWSYPKCIYCRVNMFFFSSARNKNFVSTIPFLQTLTNYSQILAKAGCIPTKWRLNKETSVFRPHRDSNMTLLVTTHKSKVAGSVQSSLHLSPPHSTGRCFLFLFLFFFYPTDISQGTLHCFAGIKIHWRLYLLQHCRTMRGDVVVSHYDGCPPIPIRACGMPGAQLEADL